LPEHGVSTHAFASALYFNEQYAKPVSDARVERLPAGAQTQRWATWLYRKEMQVQLRLGYWEPGFAWARLYGIPAVRRLLDREPCDAMISVSPPISSHWAALRIKRLYPKLLWIADFQDPFLGNPFHFRPKPPGRRVKGFEQALFGEADILSANTDTVADMWRQYYPEYAKKITVTWGGYDPEELIPRHTPTSGPPVMAHIGALYEGRNPVALLKALERMSASGRLKSSDLVVDFLGNLKFEGAEALARDLESKGLLRLRNMNVARRNALEEAAQAHFSLLLDITPGNKQLQVPAKLFDQIRLGRPILAITPPGSPSERILAASGIAYQSVAPDGDPEAYEAAILALLRLGSETREPSDSFRNSFDARNLAGLMASRIKERQ
jgi:glycosyltransferase involved in cell wall biosynthesis